MTPARPAPSRVAIVQEPPAVLDLSEGVRRAAAHVAAAACEGAQLVVFPETWLTGYPAWIFGMAAWDDAEARHWYGRLLEQCPTVDGDELDPLRRAAAAHGVVVALGLNERARPGAGTLYNSLLYLGTSGETLGVHRKLTPTHTERIVWAPAQDASGLRVHDTPAGRVGGLVCWEHWQPVVRLAMHSQDEQIHLAAWPDMTEMHALASRTYAFEGRCHVLAAAQYLTAEDVPDEVRDAYRAGVGPDTPQTGVWFPGGSAVAGPDGHWIAGPLEECPGTVHAELDLTAALGYKHDLDVAGHYARPDVFSVTVDRRPRAAVAWLDPAAVESSPGDGVVLASMTDARGGESARGAGAHGRAVTTTVACCQVPLTVGDLGGNRARVSAAVTEAAHRGAQVVVVPELANSGYVFRDAAEAQTLAEPVDGPTVTGWAALARQLGVVVVGGFCERRAGVLHNSAVLVDPSGVRAVYRKAHLWDREKLVFTPGEDAPPVVDTDVGRLAVVLCYDLEVPEWVRLPALAGAELLCAPVNWPAFPRPDRERPAEVVRVQAAASVNRMFVAVAARAGAERGVSWVTSSAVVDPDGWPLSLSTSTDQDLLLATCDLALARDKRISPHNDVHADRRPELYAPLVAAPR